MQIPGFIGPAYSLDSVNVDHQRCVNLFPEVIESGLGKGGAVQYLKSTPGLVEALTVGTGPIRCLHTDVIGRTFVVSGNQVFTIKNDTTWKVVPQTYNTITDITQASDINVFYNVFTSVAHGFDFEGLKVRVSSTNTLPPPLLVDTDYYLKHVGGLAVDTFYIAESLYDAAEGPAYIEITGTGTGTMTVTPQIPANNLFSQDSIDVSTNIITLASHGFYTGVKVKIPTVGEVSGGIDPAADYYIIRIDDNSFKLATSAANASAGTAIDITAVSGDWTKTLLGARGEEGGAAVTLFSSTGVVKVASQSLLGEGADSSTMLVDGVNNYLYLEGASSDTFGILGAITSSEAVFDITDDVTVFTFHSSVVPGIKLRILSSAVAWGAGQVHVTMHKNSVTHYTLSVTYNSSESLTTAQLVEFFNTGAIAGKIIWKSNSSDIDLDNLSARGGGSAEVNVDLNDQTATFGSVTYSGDSYGSVPTATDIVWIDGYFVVNKGGTNKMYVSDLQGFEIDALAFASSEGKHDIIVGLADRERELWVFNELSTEVFFNTGNDAFPFERIGGGYLEVGCVASGSIAKIDSTIFWLGQTINGRGIVYAAKGLTPQRISTHAIEQAIRGYADIESATSWTYQDAGHNFYVLNFAEATWVYDLSTNLWHERAYTNEGALERHRANTHSYYNGLHLVGDYTTNDIYILDNNTYSDAGDAITRLRTSPHVSSSDLTRVMCSRLQLDMQTGIGLATGQGSDPQVMLQWSDDGGHTWSDEAWTTAGGQVGGIGEYKTRVIWRRLGSFRDRIWRVKVTDPVPVTLIAANMQIVSGDS